MYNSDLPRRAELPSSARLMRSTILAAAGAAAILVTTVLPADYGIDPTGIGRVLGLAGMGETKVRLAAEAEADRQAAAAESNAAPAGGATNAELAERIGALERSVQELVRLSTSQPPAGAGTLKTEDQVAAVPAEEATPEPAAEDVPAAEDAPAAQEEATAAQEEATAAIEPSQSELKSDSLSFTLAPGQGVEIKLAMREGAQAKFAWATEGGPVNFDTHGDGPGKKSISYEKGRGVETDKGTITAAFDGNHGWFWRNRGEQDVRLTLNTKGYYTELKGAP